MDRLIRGFDEALRTVFGNPAAASDVPGSEHPEAEMTPAERALAAALMRVNHCGEVCAQALYRGQASGAEDAELESVLRVAVREEAEHLAWTGQRVRELGGRPSTLNPVWYAGAFLLGFAAGRLARRWNLGFLAETERQVEAHLAGHLERLPAADRRSRAILEKMKADESAHAQTAVQLGAAALPKPVRAAMTAVSRVMTATAFRI